MLSEQHRQLLHQVARESIEYGVSNHREKALKAVDYPEPLQQNAASFVTLHLRQMLRGCIGTLTPRRPMVEDVSSNAYNAAFRDYRFGPLSESELVDLTVHISILGPTEAIHFNSRSELLSQLRPGIDGLVIKDNGRQATFLPAVWESLGSAEEFLQHLLVKAGLTRDYWSDSIRAERYTVEEF